MADLRLAIDESGSADLELEDGDLAVDASGLPQAILVSLFSDARADEDDTIPDGTEDRRGYWSDTPGDRWGSKVWLEHRSTLSPSTVRMVEVASREALQWLLDEQVADRVQVDAELVDGRIDVRVDVTRSSSRRWAHVWDALEASEFTAGQVSVRLLAT